MIQYVRLNEAHGVPLPVLRLLAGCKAIEDSDGSWNGGDVVEFVTEFFTRYGLDPDQPLSHYIGESEDHPLCAFVSNDKLPRGMREDIVTALDNEREWSEDDEEEEAEEIRCQFCYRELHEDEDQERKPWADEDGGLVCPGRSFIGAEHVPSD